MTMPSNTTRAGYSSDIDFKTATSCITPQVLCHVDQASLGMQHIEFKTRRCVAVCGASCTEWPRGMISSFVLKYVGVYCEYCELIMD